MATQTRCGGIFNNFVIANVPQSVSEKEFFLNSLNISRRYEQKFGTMFFFLFFTHNVHTTMVSVRMRTTTYLESPTHISLLVIQLSQGYDDD